MAQCTQTKYRAVIKKYIYDRVNVMAPAIADSRYDGCQMMLGSGLPALVPRTNILVEAGLRSSLTLQH